MSFVKKFFKFKNKEEVSENVIQTDKDETEEFDIEDEEIGEENINEKDLSEFHLQFKNILKKFTFEDTVRIDRLDSDVYLYDIIDALIYVNETNKSISISFAVHVQNDVSSKLSLELYKLKMFDIFEIIESHFIKDGEIHSGDDAFIEYDNYIISCASNMIHQDIYFGDVLEGYNCEYEKAN